MAGDYVVSLTVRNHFEVYDLAGDPRETVNRAYQMRPAIQVWQQRLAAWVQYQNAMMRALQARTR